MGVTSKLMGNFRSNGYGMLWPFTPGHCRKIPNTIKKLRTTFKARKLCAEDRVSLKPLNSKWILL